MLEALIHKEAEAASKRLQKQHSGLKKELEKAYAYIVFPSVGRAGVVIGGAYGQGEVYEQGKEAGFATLSQITLGVQIGGQTFTEIVLFNKKEAYEKFKRKGTVGFTANASGVIMKAAASGTTNFADVVAHAYASGGMLLEISLGGSKLMFIPSQISHNGHTNGQPEQRSQQQQSQEQQDQTENQDGGLDIADVAGGTIGKEALKLLSSHPVISSVVSSLRFISPFLPHKKGEESVIGKFAKQVSAVQTEKKVSETLHNEIKAVIQILHDNFPQIESNLNKAYGYAIFPNLGGASLVLGGATGKGEVYEHHKLIGYGQLIQATIGVQLGGQSFTEILIFPDKESLDKFKEGKVSFVANVAAAIVKAGVMKTTKYQGIGVVVISEGGLVVEAALGIQKFVFRQAFLTKGTRDAGGDGKAALSESHQETGDDHSKTAHESSAKKIGRFIVERMH